MKTSELRDKSPEQLVELEKQLRDQLIRLGVLKATQRPTNSAQFGATKITIPGARPGRDGAPPAGDQPPRGGRPAAQEAGRGEAGLSRHAGEGS